MELIKIEKPNQIRIIYMGTPEFSVPVLDGLVQNYVVRAVVSQPNRMKKSGDWLVPPVKQYADEHVILTLQPEKIADSVQEILDFEPNLIITCAYGQKLPSELLNYPTLGCYNVHASLLPKLRGGAPIQRAIISGFTETGITIIKMNESLDGGDILAKRAIPIEESDNATSLALKLSQLGRELLLDVLPDIIAGNVFLEPQNHSEATLALTIKKEDEKLDLMKSAKQVLNQIRGLSDVPGAYCLIDNQRLKVFKAKLGEHFFENALPGEITAIYDDGFGVKVSNREIVFLEVQPEGGRKMNAVDYIRGLSNREKTIGKILR